MERNWTIHTEPEDGVVERVSIGIRNLPVTPYKLFFHSRAADEVRLRLEPASPLVEPSRAWEHFKLGEPYWFSCDWIRRGEVVPDRPMFVGTLAKMTPSDAGDSLSAEFVFLGGWYYLEKTISGDERTLSGYGFYWLPREGPYNSPPNALVRSCLYRAGKAKDSCIFYPNATGLNSPSVYFSVDVSDLALPKMEVNSNTCARVVERAISLWPDVQTWTEFSTVTMHDGGTPFPRLMLQRRREAPMALLPSTEIYDIDDPAACDIEEGDIEEGDDPSGAGDRIMVFGDGKVVSRRYERNGPSCPGVIVMKLDGSGNVEAIRDTGGGTPIPDRIGILSFALTPEEYNGTNSFHTVDGNPTIHSVLPTEIWSDHLKRTFWNGTVVLSGEDPPGLFSIRPDRWLGLNLDLAPSPIQSVEFDIGLGLTTIETGWPASLDPRDLFSLVRANRCWRYPYGQAM